MLDLDIKIKYTSKTLITVDISEVEVNQRRSNEEALKELQSFPPKVEKVMVGVRLHRVELTRVFSLYQVLKNLSEQKRVEIKCYGYTSLAGIVLVRAATPGYRKASQHSLICLKCNTIGSKSKTVKLLMSKAPELSRLSKFILNDGENDIWLTSNCFLERKLIDKIE